MGLLSGSLTARRFRVVGDLPPDWRERFREQLEKNCFREPVGRAGKEEYEGWVRVQNMLDTDFNDANLWLFNNYALFALRVDKKTLPGKLLNATVERRCRAWAAEASVQRVPTAKKKEIKEAIEAEWLERALPRVQLTEIGWDIVEGWALISGASEKVVDRVRKRFVRTFGLDLLPWSPLDAIAAPATVENLLQSKPARWSAS
jgi:DNA recombination-dependent growth factor C